jgi:hypothetical protein
MYCYHCRDVFWICGLVAFSSHCVEHLLRRGIFPKFALLVHGDAGHLAGSREGESVGQIMHGRIWEVRHVISGVEWISGSAA